MSMDEVRLDFAMSLGVCYVSECDRCFTSEGKVLTQEFAWETAEITHDGSSYPVKSSNKLLLKLTNTAQGEALVEAKLQFVAGIPCDRCLEEVEVPFDLSIVQKLVAPDRADQDALEEQEAFMEGYSLNIDSLIDNEITTSWPMKVLCRPDCKGLCPVCGKDLNTGACGCDTFCSRSEDGGNHGCL